MERTGFPTKLSVISVISVISVSLFAQPAARNPQPVTFSRDIAPIVYQHCSTCHRPGEAGPFPLLTFDDVRPRAKQIADVTRRRTMPPWPPSPDGPKLAGERRLTEKHIQLIQSWVASGAPEGDRADLPPRPTWTDGWQLGTPDLVVAMEQPFAVTPGGQEIFRRFVASIPLDRPRYVRAVEFRPGHARLVHHAILRLDPTRSTRRLLAQRTGDEGPGFGGMLFPEDASRGPDGFFIGWSPGRVASTGPRDLAWRLDPGTDLVFELHLMPSETSADVRATAGFFFSDTPPARMPFGLQLGSYLIDIPPGDRNYRIEDSYQLPVDLDVMSVYPHAHYLGKEVDVTATLPDGTRKRLLAIDDWNFNWQDEYRFAEPVSLPRGSSIAMRIRYDNSVENPRNPRRPPARVTYGGRSIDEMGNVWMQVVPRRAADMTALRNDYFEKSLRRNAESYEKLVAERPQHSGLRLELGSHYVRLGRLREGIEQLTEAVRLNDADAVAHYNLGTALSSAGAIDAAERHFVRAIELNPDYAEAHNNLGALLARARGRIEEAVSHYRRALQSSPDYIDPRYNLGVALLLLRRPAEAIPELERVQRARPDHADALSTLAWLLATSGDATLRQPARAIELAERAAALAPADASTIDTLGAAYAAGGQFERAVDAAQKALALATSAGQKNLAADIAARIELFKQRRVYVER